ncbi:peptidoglycan-binding protein [Streptomyces sp. NPDC055254]
MSHEPVQRGAATPDDRRLVRPYAPVPGPASSSPPSPLFVPGPAAFPGSEPPPGPAWPESGPPAFPGPTGPRAAGSVPYPTAAPAAGGRPAVSPAEDGRGGSRLKVAVLTLLALAAVGALASVLLGPDAAPPKASPPLRLPNPVLPAHSRAAVTDEPASAPGSPSPSLSPSPTPDRSTSQKVQSPTGAPGPSATRPTSPATTAEDGTLRPGDRGPEVRTLQERLRAQGFTYVNVTGVYDGNTRRGVSQLQSDRNITGDPRGIYGPATRAAFE